MLLADRHRGSLRPRGRINDRSSADLSTRISLFGQALIMCNEDASRIQRPYASKHFQKPHPLWLSVTEPFSRRGVRWVLNHAAR